ncbi:hypothetical protein K1719_006133 [Acacia pycnantha]|nr:hypothetical protein K1719_006133 [Acacia pycnantha]
MASSADPVVNFPSIRPPIFVASRSLPMNRLNSPPSPPPTTPSPTLVETTVQHLAKACEEWGFFMVISHGIPVSLIDDVISLSQEFHNLSDEDKAEFTDKGVITHPHWAFPLKRQGFNDVAKEYCRETRKVARKLLEGISESLDLEPEAIAKATGFDTGHQVFIANLYPPCPRPELALGMPPHSDHGFLALLIQNDIGGIQISHKGNWVNGEPLPNSILVNTADQLEVASNVRYRSVLHEFVNKKETRISVVTVNGPDLEKEVRPMPELMEREEAVFRGMKFKEYYELQQKNKLDGKTCMDHIRIKPRE